MRCRPPPLRLWFAPLCLAAMAFCPAPASAAGQPAGDRQQVMAHVQRGNAFYESGAYDRAIEEYQAAYTLSQLPGLLFNLGQAYRLKGDRRPALDCYQRFVAAKPHARGSDEAREHIAKLTAELEAEDPAQRRAPAASGSAPMAAPAPAPPPAPVATAPRPMVAPPVKSEPEKAEPGARPAPSAPMLGTAGAVARLTSQPSTASPTLPAPDAPRAPTDTATAHSGIRLAPLIVGGAGLTLAVAGGAFLWSVRTGLDDLDNMGCAPHCNTSLVDGLRTRAIVGYTLVGAGAAAAVGGAIWFWLDWRRAHDAARRAWIVPTIGGAAAGGSF